MFKMRVVHFVYTFIPVLFSAFDKDLVLLKKSLIFVIWKNLWKE